MLRYGERSEHLLRWRRAAGELRARWFCFGERSEPLLHWAAHTHGPGAARAGHTHGPGVRSKILCSGEAGQRQILFFFWPKEGRKKRENNSIVNTKKNVSPGGVGFFWSGQFWSFLSKKRGFFFNLLPTPRARARASRCWKWKKTDFFWELKKIFTGSTVAF